MIRWFVSRVAATRMCDTVASGGCSAQAVGRPASFTRVSTCFRVSFRVSFRVCFRVFSCVFPHWVNKGGTKKWLNGQRSRLGLGRD